MRKRFTTLLMTAGLAAAGLGVAAPAQADVPCTITNFSPREAVVGLTPVTRTFSISTTGCTGTGWDLMDVDLDFYADETDSRVALTPDDNSLAGAKDVLATAYNGNVVEQQKVFTDGFRLKRATTWQKGSFNASPEPVKKGAKLSISGRLLLVDWSNEKYVGYGGRTVSIQFRTPTGAYTTVKTATTDKYGWVRTTVPASRTGVWRASYAGSTVSGSAVATGDAVTVKP
jgi:hypothetical protein